MVHRTHSEGEKSEIRSTKYEIHPPEAGKNPNIECSKFKTKVSRKRHFGYFDICISIFLQSSFPPKEKTEANSSVECSKSKE